MRSHQVEIPSTSCLLLASVPLFPSFSCWRRGPPVKRWTLYLHFKALPFLVGLCTRVISFLFPISSSLIVPFYSAFKHTQVALIKKKKIFLSSSSTSFSSSHSLPLISFINLWKVLLTYSVSFFSPPSYSSTPSIWISAIPQKPLSVRSSFLISHFTWPFPLSNTFFFQILWHHISEIIISSLAFPSWPSLTALPLCDH